MSRPVPMLLACVLMLVVALAPGCKGNNDSKPPEVQAVEDMLTQEQEEIFTRNGLPLERGTNPPDVSGIYKADNLDCYYDDTQVFLDNLHYFYNFFAQSGLNISLRYENEERSDIGNGRGTFILGDASTGNFSVYDESAGTASGIPYTQVGVYSGTVTAEGIRNFRYGFIMTEKQGDSDNEELMPVNAARIYLEGDLLAERANHVFASFIKAAAPARGESLGAAR